MSRKIDLTKPLTKEDQFYLQERSDYRFAQAKQLAEENGWEWHDLTKYREDLVKGEQDPDADPLGENTGDVNTPKDLVTLGTGPQPESDDNSVSLALADPSLADKPYGDWTNDQLRSEIDKRNEDLDDDDKMSTSGVKQDLVDRLEEDDELRDADEDDDEDSGN